MDWRSLPKVELHLHLAGSLRIATVRELLAEEGAAPARASEYRAAAAGEGLSRYLARFHAYDAAMRAPERVARAVAELGEDLAADGVRYAEVRFRPPGEITDDGLWDAYVAAALDGAEVARRRCGTRLQLIVVVLRTWAPERSARELLRAARWYGRGVVGVDVAGDEAAGGLRELAPLLAEARANGLGVTVHAGEACGAAAVAEALDLVQPDRIAHGVRASEDPAVEARLAEERTHLEVAVTSNLQTGAINTLARHPIARWIEEQRLNVGLNTDNRTISGVTLSGELTLVAAELGARPATLGACMRRAAQAAFLPPHERQDLAKEIDAGWSML